MRIILFTVCISGLILFGCDDPAGNKKTDITSPCIDHLKGQTFELYRIDTQSFRQSDMQPAGQRSSIAVDSNSSTYKQYVISNTGDSMTIVSKFYSLTRAMHIKGDTLYLGDGKLPIQSCGENEILLVEFDEGATKEIFVKTIGYLRKR